MVSSNYSYLIIITIKWSYACHDIIVRYFRPYNMLKKFMESMIHFLIYFEICHFPFIKKGATDLLTLKEIQKSVRKLIEGQLLLTKLSNCQNKK